MTTPTEEQLHILSRCAANEGNIIINALAGTGKTTTLKMIDGVVKRQPMLYLAFNKRVVEEVEKERRAALKDKTVRSFGPHVVVQTINSCCHRAWGSARGKKLTLDSKKTFTIFKQIVEEENGEDARDLWDNYPLIRDAVSMAKNIGYIPDGKFSGISRLASKEDLNAYLEEPPAAHTWEVIDRVLFQAIKSAYDGWIDFDDQIFMPTLFGGSFQRYPTVLLDETQDFNPVNHEMLKKLRANRFYAVGDRYQSIYAFRGAVTNGMQRIREQFKCEATDLSTSFRCPEVIVEEARWRAPHFQWVKPGGEYTRLRSLDLKDIPEGAAILCRNNAPLFTLAFALLCEGRGVQVAGSEIGPKLIKLLEKIGGERDSQEDLLAKIEAWKEAKLETSQNPGAILDQAACLRVFATFGESLAQAVAYCEHLFKQQGAIQLSTGHKAKGLEWDTVFFLDPGLCRDDEQDKNLRYVIQTRAKQTLYEIDSENIRW